MKKLATVCYALLFIALLVAPFVGAYPVFVMKLLCFALFASAFNLLLGYTGLLSFGHAAFLGGSAYVAGFVIKSWGFTPELGLIAGTRPARCWAGSSGCWPFAGRASISR